MGARRRTRRARTVRPNAAPRRPALPPPRSPLAESYGPQLPTAHAICRFCGRILRVGLSPEEIANLRAFVDRRPYGWTVEGMSFSLTGVCPNCQATRGA